MRVESWADHAVLWQVYPLGFTGAERSALPAVRESFPSAWFLGAMIHGA
jgi:hypothetical protein